MQIKYTLFDAAVLLLGLAAGVDAFDASNATLEEFSSYALNVSKARVANSTGCSLDKISVRKYW